MNTNHSYPTCDKDGELCSLKLGPIPGFVDTVPPFDFCTRKLQCKPFGDLRSSSLLTRQFVASGENHQSSLRCLP